MKRTAALAVAVLALGGLAACGDDDEASGPEVEGAWARTSPMAVDVGAMYMEITSPEADRLTAVTVGPDVAARTEIHETVAAEGEMSEGEMTEGTMADEGMTEGTMAEGEMEGGMEGGMEGAMTMQQIPFLELPADETVSLAPGGYHVMMLELAEPLEVGDTFDATLVFENADPVVVTVEVRDEAP